MTISYVHIGLLLLALFLIVHLGQRYSPAMDKLSYITDKLNPKRINGILIHPKDEASLSSSSISSSLTTPVVSPAIGSITSGTVNTPMVNNLSTASIPANGNSSLLGSAQEGLAVQPVDYDTMFQSQQLQPNDLLPPTNPDLFPGFDGNLNQNFMSNEIQAALPTSNRRKYITDLRPIMPPPVTYTPIWNQPTTFPDITRKSICDL